MPRIERRHRVLKDHLHAPAQRLPFVLIERGNVAAVEHDRSGRRLDQAEQRPPERRFARAGLADDADRFAFADADIDAVQNGRHRPSALEQTPTLPVGRPRARCATRRSSAIVRSRDAGVESRNLGAQRGDRPPAASAQARCRGGRSADWRRAAPWYRRDAAHSARRPWCPAPPPCPCTGRVTRSQIFATTPRSWETNSTLVPWRSCSARISRRICFCTVTSSAVVGSSAMTSFGSSPKAAAISTRWRMPPESSCG